MKTQIKNSAAILGSIGAMGGFIADVLTPLGPFTKWLFIIFSILTIVLFVIYLKNKTKKYLPLSFTLSVIFGSLFLFNGDSKNGVLGDNIDFVSSIQSSMNLVEAELDSISDKIDKIDNKLDEGFSVVEDNNRMIEDVSETQYEILTSIESLNDIGDDLRSVLGISKITLSAHTKNKSNQQLKTEDYKTLYKHFVHRMMSYSFNMSVAGNTHNEKLLEASKTVPNTDIGYYARAKLSANNNDYESSDKFIDSSLAVNPKLFIAYNYKGLQKEDIELLNKAFQLEPNSFVVNWNRGRLFYKKFTATGSNDFRILNKALKDLNRGYSLTNKEGQNLAVSIMSYLWDQKEWSNLQDFLNEQIPDKNSFIKYIKETHGEDLYSELYSKMFLLNGHNSKTIDIKFIQTDFNNELNKAFFGYFLLNKKIGSPSYTVEVEGKYIDVDEEKYIALYFDLPDKPFIDNRSLSATTVTMFINREDYEEEIYNLRRAGNGEIYSMVGLLSGEFGGAPCFEARYISEGLFNPDKFEKAIVKSGGLVEFN